MAKTRYEKLHCAAGDHEWDWPIKRGRKPANCPAHKPEPLVQERQGPSEVALRTIITRVTTERSAKGSHCRCDFAYTTTWDDLRDMGSGCTGGSGFTGGYVCPTLDAIRRQADKLR